MAYHTDLLRQAMHLATKEPKRPLQASLRRAVSAAYYALFHYLIEQACNQVVNHAPGKMELRRKLGRAFQHAQMKSAAKAFSSGAQQKQNKWFDVTQIPQALNDVAEAFVELQEARHSADQAARACDPRNRASLPAIVHRAALSRYPAL